MSISIVFAAVNVRIKSSLKTERTKQMKRKTQKWEKKKLK